MTEPVRPQAAGRAVAKGAGLMIGLRFADRLIGIASFAILARLLHPDDFGLFALALSIVAIIEPLGNWGFDSALIQDRGNDRRYYDTAWTLKALIGAGVALVLCAAALPAARAFTEPRIEPVLYWLALGAFVGGFENIGVVDFLKTLDYRRELAYRLAIRITVTVLAILFALAWQSYWALVAGSVARNFGTLLLSYAVHPYRPRWSLSHLDRLGRFTRWMFLRNLFQGLSDNIANLVLGRRVGVGELSFFSVARELSTFVATDVYAPVRRALFPAYASVSHDLVALKRLVLDAAAVMTLLGLPLSAGLAVVAGDAVRVLLGERWLEAVPLLQILALAGCIGAGISGAPTVFVATGRPDAAAKLAGFRFAVLGVSVLIGTSLAGARGAAWAMVATATIMLVVNGRMVGGHLAITTAEARRAFGRPFVASAIMALVVLAELRALPDGTTFASSLVRLCVGVASGALIYGIALMALWRWTGRPEGAERHVLDVIAGLGKRWWPERGHVQGGGP